MTTTLEGQQPSTLEEKILTVALEAHAEGGSRRPTYRRTAVAALASAIAFAIVVPIVLPGEGRGGADPAAADALHRVALRASAQPAEPAPKAGQFRYSRSDSMSTMLYVVGNGETFTFHATTTRESWVGPDGSGRIHYTPGAITFPTKVDEGKWVAAGSPSLQWVIEGDDEFEHLAPGELTFQDYSDLPTNPEELLDVIERRELVGGPPGDWETFVIIGDLLRETYTTPRVRAALYEVAAELPSVELVGRVVDGAGRTGIAVAYTNPGGDARSRFQLIFDPKTAELLAEEEVLVADSTVDVQSGGPGAVYGGVGPAGTLVYSTSYLVSGTVESTRERLLSA